MESVNIPRYLSIAYDIAKKITEDKFIEGEKIRGRSLLASHYQVSSETIRKAIAHLSKLNVVIVKPSSGIYVNSKLMANEYISMNFIDFDNRRMFDEIKSLINENTKNNKKLLKNIEFYTKLKNVNDLFNPIPFFTLIIKSEFNRKKLSYLNIYNSTGSVVFGLVREHEIISSPNDLTTLKTDDILYIAGDQIVQSKVNTHIETLKK